MNLIQTLQNAQLLQFPKFIPDNTHLIIRGGSYAYGVNTESSDIDVYGVCVPPRDIIFPYEKDFVYGLGQPPPTFHVTQCHHIEYENKQYDVTVYSIVRFFDLAFGGNPNIIDIIYAPERCVLHQTKIGRIIRENKEIFLSKRLIQKIKSFSGSHLQNVRTYNPKGKRKELLEKFGYDTKDAATCIRAIKAAYSILSCIDYVQDEHASYIQEIRNGKYSLDELCEVYELTLKKVNDLLETSILQDEPNLGLVRELLVRCLEIQYGKLDMTKQTSAEMKLKRIQNILLES